jgi:hypothetical protein
MLSFTGMIFRRLYTNLHRIFGSQSLFYATPLRLGNKEFEVFHLFGVVSMIQTHALLDVPRHSQ